MTRSRHLRCFAQQRLEPRFDLSKLSGLSDLPDLPDLSDA